MGGFRGRAAGAIGAVLLLGSMGTGCATDVSGDIGAEPIYQFDLSDTGIISVCQPKVGTSWTRGFVVRPDGSGLRPLVGANTENNCPFAVNDLGTVVGHSGDRAGVWHPDGRWEPLTLPDGAATSRATDINDAGLVVGRFTMPPFEEGLPIVWDLAAGTMDTSPPQFEQVSENVDPQKVNERGTIVARVWSDSFVFFADGTRGPSVAPNGDVRALADNDDVLATAVRKLGPWNYQTALLHTDARTGTMKEFTIPGASSAIVEDLDDQRRVVGTASINGRSQAFRFGLDTGAIETFDAEGQAGTIGYATNDAGQIAGVVNRADGTRVLRIWG